MATIIRADGTESELHGPKGPRSSLTLEQLHEAVDGYIEIVRPSITGTMPPGYVLVVNEEGMVDGLPINRRASALAGQPIAGNVVLGELWIEVD